MSGLAALLAWLTAAAPGVAAPDAGLVDVSTALPRVVLDMRYATAHNFMHKAVYAHARCLLNGEVVAHLEKVEASLERQGFRLKLWDCYRPFSVQQEMWKLVPVRGLVADPSRGGSRHNRGTAVDASLVGLDGGEVAMPSDHDDFTAKGKRDAPCARAEARAHRAVLRKAMEDEGFTTIRTEWWHFEQPQAATSGPLDEPL